MFVCVSSYLITKMYKFYIVSSHLYYSASLYNYTKDFGLTNISYTGFIRVTGYKSLLSAGDMSLAVTALLECEANTNNQNTLGKNTSSTETQLQDGTTSTEEKENRILMESFNLAYDALNSNGGNSSSSLIESDGVSCLMNEGSDLSNFVNGGDVTSATTGVGAGIRLAMTLQKLIISTAVNLVERKAVTRLSHFRYAYLHVTSHNGTNTFGSSTTSCGSLHSSPSAQLSSVHYPSFANS